MGASSQAAVEQEPITLEPRRSGRVRREIKRYGFLVTDSDTIELVDREDSANCHMLLRVQTRINGLRP